MSKRKYNVLSLFSGAMGLDLGFEHSDRFNIVACVEVEPDYCATIEHNRDRGLVKNKDLVVINQDIRKVKPSSLLKFIGMKASDIDVIIGGPPCQSFSTTGKRGTVQDPRGELLWEYLRFVDEIRPKFFVMENVRGLMSAAIKHRPIAKRPDKGGPPLTKDEQPGSVFKLWAEDLMKISDKYRLDCFEVNAVNYGAPQLRERMVAIGNRMGQVVDFPDPTHGTREEVVDADLLSDLAELKPLRTLGDALKGLSEKKPTIMDFSPRKKKYLSMVPPGGNWRTLPLKVQKESMGKAFVAKGGRSGWWRRLSMDLPCPTLVTMPNHASTSLCHPNEVRALTVREYARIQEFPDAWEFLGKPQAQYTQVGNAVPVRLGVIAARVIASQLDISDPKAETLRKVYVQSHVRTRQWFKDGEVITWQDGESNDQAQYKAPVTRRSVQALLAEA